MHPHTCMYDCGTPSSEFGRWCQPDSRTVRLARDSLTLLGRWGLRVTLAVVLSGLVLLAHFVTRAKVFYYTPHVRSTQESEVILQ